eukprot:566722-Rhodomonas_salina.1
MSGTDLAYGAIGLRGCYEMSGTDLAHSTASDVAPGGGKEEEEREQEQKLALGSRGERGVGLSD